MIVRGISSHASFSRSKMGKSELLRGGQVFAGLNCFLPGQVHSLHSHAGQDKLYLILEGQGNVTVGSETDLVEAGDLVLAREGVAHALENPGPGKLVVLAVMAPPPGPKPTPSGH